MAEKINSFLGMQAQIPETTDLNTMVFTWFSGQIYSLAEVNKMEMDHN